MTICLHVCRCFHSTYIVCVHIVTLHTNYNPVLNPNYIHNVKSVRSIYFSHIYYIMKVGPVQGNTNFSYGNMVKKKKVMTLALHSRRESGH